MHNSASTEARVHDDECGSKKRFETTAEDGENNIESQNWNDEGDESMKARALQSAGSERPRLLSDFT